MTDIDSIYRMIGRLMSPQEAFDELAERTDIPASCKQRWYLCGTIPVAMWNSLRQGKSRYAFRVRAFTTPTPSAFVIFTLQCRGTQVRFVMGLGDSRVNLFLRDVCRQGVMLHLTTKDSSLAHHLHFTIEPTKLMPVLKISEARPVNSPEAMATELGGLLIEAQRADLIPTAIPGISVVEACPVIILPETDESQ